MVGPAEGNLLLKPLSKVFTAQYTDVYIKCKIFCLHYKSLSQVFDNHIQQIFYIFNIGKYTGIFSLYYSISLQNPISVRPNCFVTLCRAQTTQYQPDPKDGGCRGGSDTICEHLVQQSIILSRIVYRNGQQPTLHLGRQQRRNRKTSMFDFLVYLPSHHAHCDSKQWLVG